MSCDTLNASAINLNVAVASLPEGFCPASMQELANAIGARLIITPSSTFNSFAIGSTAPASNVGPWLKDCNQWFVFDDETGTYVPIGNVTPGGFKNEEYHTTSGTFVVPDFIYKIKVQLWGAGGGGGRDTGNVGAGGGGGGGYVLKIFDVTPAQAIGYMIGSGGAGGTPGTAGGNSTFLTLTAGGGQGATGGANQIGGIGGTATGGDMNVLGEGGGYAYSTAGRGGSSSSGGGGGQYTTPSDPLVQNGIVPGGGGAGSYSSAVAGNGASGGVLITY